MFFNVNTKIAKRITKTNGCKKTHFFYCVGSTVWYNRVTSNGNLQTNKGPVSINIAQSDNYWCFNMISMKRLNRKLCKTIPVLILFRDCQFFLIEFCLSIHFIINYSKEVEICSSPQQVYPLVGHLKESVISLKLCKSLVLECCCGKKDGSRSYSSDKVNRQVWARFLCDDCLGNPSVW